MQTVKKSGVARATFQIDYDDEVAFAAQRCLLNVARDKARGQNAPFALEASCIHPHDPYVSRPERWNLHQDEDINMPTYVPKAEGQDPFSKKAYGQDIGVLCSPSQRKITPREARISGQRQLL